MTQDQKDVYIKFLRIFVLLIAGFLWYLSIGWSANGFSIDDESLKWIGVGLALSITGAQLLFNRGASNPTIFLVGLAAYLYGFATNFIGISATVGINFAESGITIKTIAQSLGVGALSLTVEAAPESFLLWALYPQEKTPGEIRQTFNLQKRVLKRPWVYTRVTV